VGLSFGSCGGKGKACYPTLVRGCALLFLWVLSGEALFFQSFWEERHRPGHGGVFLSNLFGGVAFAQSVGGGVVASWCTCYVLLV
jgi:hypothetical protein